MLERSPLAENALLSLHDEDYARPYDRRDLDAGGLIHSRFREHLSLDGEWNFCVDLLDTGLRQKWFALPPPTGPQRDLPWDYDPYLGETVPVPSCWQMLREKWYFFEGAAWFTRAFDLDPAPGRRRFLRVGAASYDCKVFLNGRFLGSHRGGSTPFCVDLTGALAAGGNWLMLCVDNRRAPDRVPMQNTDWFNYGGLFREVAILDLPEGFVKGFFLHLLPDGSDRRIRAEVETEGPVAGPARLRIPGLGIDLEVPLAKGRGEIVFEAAPELWSPENPRLYDVEVAAGADTVRDRIGLRRIERRGTQILLNGRPLWLRGISVHEDDETLGKVATEADLRRRLADARALGCNFLRLAHYPHHERAAELADEEGMLLWEEIPVYWAIDFANPATRRDADNQLRELIRRDRNRASVILWSVGNETPDTDARLAFMGGLAATARAEDPSRLVAAACLVNHAKLRIEDRLAEHLDVIGINEYYGWYERDFADLAAIGRNSTPDRPVLISETGADADMGPEAPTAGLFSAAWQAEVYRRQIAILRGLDYVRGMTPWILYDFRSERRQNRYQRGFNRKGLICADKTTRKPAFEVLARFYSEKAAEERP